MNVSVEDLKYAKNITLPIVNAAYSRFQGKAGDVAGITHLADITVERADLDRFAAEEDAATRKLLYQVFGDNNLFGGLEREDATGTGFVVFRGTQTAADWIENARLLAAPFKEVAGAPAVHVGFHRVYQLVRKSLTSQLASLNFAAGLNRVIVTGHSLGGAVASLCALDLASHGVLPNLECCTFASPRTFYFTASSFVTAVPKSLRVANSLDIVTRVPPRELGYVHVHGGLDIAPKFEDFHDLDKTYGPGLQQIIEQATHSVIAVRDAESVLGNG